MGSQGVQKWLESRTRRPAFLWWLGGGAGVFLSMHRLGRMWFELPTGLKVGSTQAFLSTCPDVGQTMKGGNGGS